MKPIVAIVGRPNVGKSALFNRMTRSRKALVDDFPGVTRDRIFGDAQWDDVSFTVVDTGGFSGFEPGALASQVQYQVMQAIEEADAVVMVFDGRDGLNPVDVDLVQRLRPGNKPVFYAVNKIDGPRFESHMADFTVLGVDPMYPVSAQDRYGMNDFMDALTRALPQASHETAGHRVRLAVVGRPNVGKSSLINRLLGDERLVVGELPGTTRDAVDTVCTVDGQEYVLIDTAGIRRKKQVRKKLEKFSILKALKSLERCHIALLMVDAAEGLSDQDVRIAGYVWERNRACVVLLNKWDLVDKDVTTAQHHVEKVRHRLKFLSFAPLLTVSALTGARVFEIFDRIGPIYEQYTTRIGTGKLNRILETITRAHEPPSHRGRRIKFYYITQSSASPPTFVCFVNYPEAIHFSYKRYVTNELRKALALHETPIRLLFRKRQ